MTMFMIDHDAWLHYPVWRKWVEAARFTATVIVLFIAVGFVLDVLLAAGGLRTGATEAWVGEPLAERLVMLALAAPIAVVLLRILMDAIVFRRAFLAALSSLAGDDVLKPGRAWSASLEGRWLPGFLAAWAGAVLFVLLLNVAMLATMPESRLAALLAVVLIIIAAGIVVKAHAYERYYRALRRLTDAASSGTLNHESDPK